MISISTLCKESTPGPLSYEETEKGHDAVVVARLQVERDDIYINSKDNNKRTPVSVRL